MAPGILAQSVLFMAIFYGIAVIWERDLGTLHKLLVSPARRRWCAEPAGLPDEIASAHGVTCVVVCSFT